MTQEKLEKGRELFMAIKDCEHEIKDILEMVETDFKYFYLNGETKHYQHKVAKLDEVTFNIFLNKVLNDCRTRLSELETEFNNL
jgi:inorganic pyrophosphatase/exopolyphosphatase